MIGISDTTVIKDQNRPIFGQAWSERTPIFFEAWPFEIHNM